jgi:hypothetical protein
LRLLTKNRLIVPGSGLRGGCGPVVAVLHGDVSGIVIVEMAQGVATVVSCCASVRKAWLCGVVEFAEIVVIGLPNDPAVWEGLTV